MISVILPVYNTEAYLRPCIDSILRQTYRDFELLAVDDGSTDGSGSILDAYALADARVRVFHIANAGVSNARNIALENACGSYIAFVDSDDFIAPEMLETLLSLTDGSSLDAAMCDATDVYPDGQKPSELTVGLPDTAENAEILRVFLGKSATLWNKLIGKSCIGNARFPMGVNYCEDLLFLSEIAPRISRLRVTRTPLYFYRREREGSVVASGLNSTHTTLIRAMKAACDALNAHGFHREAASRARLCAGRVLKAAAAIPFSESKPYRAEVKRLLNENGAYASSLLGDSAKTPPVRLIRYLEYRACQTSPEAVVLFYKLIRVGRKTLC